MWKNLKGYFVVEEEGKPKAAKTLPNNKIKGPAASGTTSPKTSSSAPAAPPSSSGAVAGSVNDRSIKVLMEAMEAANLPGFDYLEYKKSLQNLKKMNFTDEIRFQTAYTAAQSMGVLPEQLQQSAQHYLDVLDKEHKKFSQALQGQRQQQIGAREQELDQIDADIKRQEAKIKELQAQIAKSKAKQSKLKSTIEGSVSKLTKTQADFEATLAVITDGIKADMASMKNFLK